MSEEIKKIEVKVVELKEELRKSRFANAIGQLDDISKIKKAKKEVARLLTKKGQLSKEADLVS